MEFVNELVSQNLNQQLSRYMFLKVIKCLEQNT